MRETYKKYLIWVLMAVLTLFAGCEAQSYSAELVVVSTSRDEILEEEPGIEISAEDMALLDGLLECEAVKTLFAENEFGQVLPPDDPEVLAVVEQHPDGALIKTGSVETMMWLDGDWGLVLNWNGNNGRRIIMEKADMAGRPFLAKTIGRGMGDPKNTIYSNANNQNYRKSVFQHIWFTYMQNIFKENWNVPAPGTK